MIPTDEAIAPATALAEVERRLAAFFDDARARSRDRHPRFEELWLATRAAATGGKRLRPRLVVAPYLLLDGAPLPPAIELAVAIELLHTALLLHDDVIDGDVERRGAPNVAGTFERAAVEAGAPRRVAQGWGVSAAILAGDLMLTSALRLVAGLRVDEDRRERIVDLVDESVFRAAAGELADVAYAAGLDTPSASAIRQMMADKTAHYSLELPLRAAAILAGSPEPLGERLGAIGRSLGLVFQMRDDLLGVFGRSEETGKSTVGDLREGKRTLLIAFADGTAEWTAVAADFGNADLDEAGAQRLRDALESSGARDRLEAEMRRECGIAHRLIDEAGLPDRLAHLLATEVDDAAERCA
ncbi:polyprenyl synthetase family protein [Microbacterium sp.]|uniref:polyprenyl synthetase family protein n=1 Tax=Microbacterium sp. TaxID=51671 RepID=UPI001ACF334E|nr:polyprenyl synthetase family protein [Microbacterium sp.]MBN9185977.1 polyprenyl synthetase family protein [Microbacterium sp.]MBN9191016.1 polyprenyl synthetase family protein [Microbacterium sp.]